MTSAEARATRWLRYVSLVRGDVHLLLDDGTVWRIPGETRVERFIRRRYRDLELLGDARARVAVFGDGLAADVVFGGHGLELLLGEEPAGYPSPPHENGLPSTV
jgi:hypothetical protein